MHVVHVHVHVHIPQVLFITRTDLFLFLFLSSFLSPACWSSLMNWGRSFLRQLRLRPNESTYSTHSSSAVRGGGVTSLSSSDWLSVVVLGLFGTSEVSFSLDDVGLDGGDWLFMCCIQRQIYQFLYTMSITRSRLDYSTPDITYYFIYTGFFFFFDPWGMWEQFFF